MTKEEITMIAALSKCNFLPGSYQKRFVRDMSYRLAHDDPEKSKPLSESQHNYLVRLFHEYRNQHHQHKESACPMCAEKKAKALADNQKLLEKWGKE